MNEAQANTPNAEADAPTTPANPPAAPSRSNYGILVVFLIIVIVGLAVLKMASGPSVETVKIKLSALELVPLTEPGGPVTLDQLKGKVAMVNFWSTSCPPCRVELPHLAELNKHFAGNEDFVLLAVSLGGGNFEMLRQDTEAFLASKDISIPTYADPNGTTAFALQQAVGWGGAIPMTFILDRSGMIRKFWLGFGPGQEKEMQAAVEELLKE